MAPRPLRLEPKPLPNGLAQVLETEARFYREKAAEDAEKAAKVGTA